MSKTVGEWVYDLAKRTGVPEDHEGLKSLLSIAFVIPDDVNEAMAGLMTVNEARNNLAVKNHFLSVLGDNVSSSIPETLAELGIDQKIIDEISAEKSTRKKVALALKKLNEVKEAQINSKETKDPEALTKANQQIAEANAKVLRIEAEAKAQLAEKDGFLTQYKQKNELSKLASSHSWSDLYPESVRDTLFSVSLQNELLKLGATMQLDGDKLVLKQSADPALNFHYQNKEFTPADLVAKVMQDNKFIAVAQKATEPIPLNGFRNPLPTAAGNGAHQKAPSAFESSLAQSMADQANAQ